MDELQMDVDLRAVFAGWRRLHPLIAFASNNRSSIFLHLYEEHMEYRMFRDHRRRYTEVGKVDYLTGPKTFNLIFYFHRPMTFIANCRTEEQAHGALRFLAARGVPLTDRARRLVDGA